MFRIVLRLMALSGLCYFTMASGECGGCGEASPLEPKVEPDPYSISPQTLRLDTAFVPWRDASSGTQLNNQSQKSLYFSGFDGSCPEQISWTPKDGPVGPGAALPVDILFKPDDLTPASSCMLTPIVSTNGSPLPPEQRKTLTVTFAAGEAKCELIPGDTLRFDPAEAGMHSDASLTIRNTTSDPDEYAPFGYVFESLSGDCDLFSWGFVDDSASSIKPGEQWSIPFSFHPVSEGEFQCEKSLATNGTPRPCPSSVVFIGTGLPGPEPVCSLILPGSGFQFGEVRVGASEDLTFTIKNETQTDIPANRFNFLFDNPSDDCDLFTIEPANGEIGPGGIPGGDENITVTFTPNRPGTFQCTRDLSSLKVGTDESIASPCPAQLTWQGTGVVDALQWSACQPDGTTNWQGVFGFSDTEVFMVGEGASVFQSTGDCEWAAVGMIPGEAEGVNLTDIWGYSGGGEEVVYAVGNIPPEPGLFSETGAIVKWDGSDWTLVDKDGLHTYSSVWGADPNHVYFGGTGVATDFPNAKFWDGNTLTPIRISDMGMNNVAGLSGTGPEDVWAMMDEPFSAIYHLTQAGWENGTPSFGIEPVTDGAVYTTTLEREVIAVGHTGAVYHYDGTNWEDVSISGETRDFHAVWVSPNGRILIVGEDQAVYLGDVGDPTEWTLLPPPPGTPVGDYLDVWGSSDDDIYIVGSDNVVLRLTPGG